MSVGWGNCYAEWEMSVIRLTTYLNDNAETPLGRFVVYMLHSQLCNKNSDKSNRWNLGQSLSVASSTVGTIISSPSSATLLIAFTECRREFFLTPQLCIQKWVTWAKPRPFRRLFVIPLARLDVVSLCIKFDSSSVSHSWHMRGAPKI